VGGEVERDFQRRYSIGGEPAADGKTCRLLFVHFTWLQPRRGCYRGKGPPDAPVLPGRVARRGGGPLPQKLFLHGGKIMRKKAWFFKNRVLWGIFGVTLVFGMMAAGCDTGVSPGSGGPATYTVTFDKNGGDTEASPAAITVTYPVIFVGTLPNPPAKTGMYFYGWYTQNGTGGNWGSRFLATTPVTGDLTVYARWGSEPPVEYTVTFNASPGTVTPVTIKVNSGDTLGTTLLTPARTGHTFGGWYTEPDGGGTQFTETTSVTGNITVYAKWTVIPGGPQPDWSYTVTFDKNGGTTDSAPKIIIVADPGHTVSVLPTPPTKTSGSDIYFQGWYTQNGTGGNWGNPFYETTQVTGDITVYAKWGSTQPTKYTVTFDPNGTGGTVSPESVTVNSGEKLGNALPTPERSGYTFEGWYTAASGGTQFTGDTPVDADITVYAKWTAGGKRLTVTGLNTWNGKNYMVGLLSSADTKNFAEGLTAGAEGTITNNSVGQAVLKTLTIGEQGLVFGNTWTGGDSYYVGILIQTGNNKCTGLISKTKYSFDSTLTTISNAAGAFEITENMDNPFGSGGSPGGGGDQKKATVTGLGASYNGLECMVGLFPANTDISYDNLVAGGSEKIVNGSAGPFGLQIPGSDLNFRDPWTSGGSYYAGIMVWDDMGELKLGVISKEKISFDAVPATVAYSASNFTSIAKTVTVTGLGGYTGGRCEVGVISSKSDPLNTMVAGGGGTITGSSTGAATLYVLNNGPGFAGLWTGGGSYYAGIMITPQDNKEPLYVISKSPISFNSASTTVTYAVGDFETLDISKVPPPSGGNSGGGVPDKPGTGDGNSPATEPVKGLSQRLRIQPRLLQWR
jgi:uncharacterized repeat protein (TIGR02543 family)